MAHQRGACSSGCSIFDPCSQGYPTFKLTPQWETFGTMLKFTQHLAASFYSKLITSPGGWELAPLVEGLCSLTSTDNTISVGGYVQNYGGVPRFSMFMHFYSVLLLSWVQLVHVRPTYP